jgi:hypothetical protein
MIAPLHVLSGRASRTARDYLGGHWECLAVTGRGVVRVPHTVDRLTHR